LLDGVSVKEFMEKGHEQDPNPPNGHDGS